MRNGVQTRRRLTVTSSIRCTCTCCGGHRILRSTSTGSGILGASAFSLCRTSVRGQDLSVDLSDCVNDVQINSLLYCSDQDEIHATVWKSFICVDVPFV